MLEGWLLGLLLFALMSALLPGAFVAVPAVGALLLIVALGCSAVACEPAGMLAAVIAALACNATASLASSGREYQLKRPIAR
jgi:hypothetical protein